MDYSVYILYDEDQDNEVITFLRGDVEVKDMAVEALFSAIENLSGVSFRDKYAMKLQNEKSVALTGSVVTELTYNTQVIKTTKYKFEGDYITDVRNSTLKHTLTVKGNLESDNAMFGIPALKKLLQKKDTSRIWEWANTKFPEANVGDEEIHPYYRDVVAQVYSDSQSVFRDLLLERASVGSYDEYYDENGEGHFTLVITKVITLPAHPDEAEISMEGPTFDTTFSSFSSDLSNAAKTAKKNVDKGLEVAEKLGADKDHIQKVKNITKTGGKMLEGTDSIVNDGGLNFDAENIADQVMDQKDNVEKGMGKDIADETTSTETQTIKNEDGSTTVIETVTHDDDSKTVKKTHKDANGKVTSIETEEYEA